MPRRKRKITKEQVRAAMPLLVAAVRGKVQMYNAMRAIETDILGFDVKADLDDTVEGMAFNCDLPEDAEQHVTERDVRELLETAKKDA